MVSLSRMTGNRRRKRLKKMGRKRKNKASERSTQSAEELFAELGECGKPAAGKAGAKKKAKPRPGNAPA